MILSNNKYIEMDKEEIMTRLKEISKRDCSYSDLTLYEKQIITFYITEAVERSHLVWDSFQLFLEWVLKHYKLQSIPMIREQLEEPKSEQP